MDSITSHYQVYHNTTDGTYEYYTPDQVPTIDTPAFSIQDHFFGEFHKTQLQDVHALYTSFRAMSSIFKSMIELQDNDPAYNYTYTIDYSIFNNEQLMDQYQSIYEEAFASIPQNPLTLDKIEELIKSHQLIEPPRHIVFIRNDGNIFSFSKINKALIEKLRSAEKFMPYAKPSTF